MRPPIRSVVEVFGYDSDASLSILGCAHNLQDRHPFFDRWLPCFAEFTYTRSTYDDNDITLHPLDKCHNIYLGNARAGEEFDFETAKNDTELKCLFCRQYIGLIKTTNDGNEALLDAEYMAYLPPRNNNILPSALPWSIQAYYIWRDWTKILFKSRQRSEFPTNFFVPVVAGVFDFSPSLYSNNMP